MKFIGIISVVACLLLGVPYMLAGWGEIKLTSDIRSAEAPGETLELESGTIHYIQRGPESGPKIIMVHGFSTPHFIFEQNAQALAEAGFRVVQFDHFGRGWSDRPRVKYDTAFYDRELLQVLDRLDIDEPVGLVGLSMGGIISTEFVANHPDRISRLFLLVPAGLVQTRDPDGFSSKLMRTPIVGDWVWRVFGQSILLSDNQDIEENLLPESRLQGEVTEQMNYRGYFPALLSSFRHLPMHGRDATFKRLAETGVPVMAVFGDVDTTISIDSADKLQSVMPEASVEIVKGGTHGLNYRKSNIVNPMLIDFFAEETALKPKDHP